MNKDLTIIFYTANVVSNHFFENVKQCLVKAIKNLPLIVVSQKPMKRFDGYEGNYKNICVGDIGQTHFNIYRQAYIGVKNAKTTKVAMAEDDIFYSAEHFDYMPAKDTFAYDRNIWSVYTWTNPPVFSYKGRKNMYGLICERDLFLKAMEERFAKYNEDNYPKHLFGEPGKYERQMGVKINEWEFYHAKNPSVAFSHPTELSFGGLGKRKKLGEKQTTNLALWGDIKNVISLYKK